MLKPNFFTTGSPYLNHPLLTQERTTREVDFVIKQARLESGQRILDVGCGPGRHSIELARRGYRVVGIDPSETMISAARTRALEAPVAPKFIQARGEEFTSDEPFDAAICLFTTLGQIDEFGENSHLISRVADLLNPGGMFIIEVPNHHWVAENLKTSERFGDSENYTEITRRYDPVEKIVSEKFDLVSSEGSREYLLKYRIFDKKKLKKYLKAADFGSISIFGDYESSSFSYKSINIIIAAQKQ